MKRLPILFLTGLLILAVGQTAEAERISRQIDVAPGDELRVELETGGDITVTGWDQDVVSIEGRIDGRDEDDVELIIEQFGGGVEVKVEHSGRRWRGDTDVDLEIKVPSVFDLDLESMGGEITVEEIEGIVNGTTMGGDLSFRGITGELDMTTMGGEILVEDSEVDGEVTTMGGDVTLRDVVGSLDASSMGGDVRYDNVKPRPEEANKVEISTMGGDIKVDHAPAGAEVSTMGGQIRVRRAAEFVQASTMGGNIDILEIDGWVEASTMGGDVEVTMVGDPTSGRRDVEITSMGGDIVLTVPAGLSMDVDIELVYTKRSRGKFSITSDFDLEQTESTEWERSRHGSQSKTITARGSVDGGQHTIQINTVNGNVHLKRGQ